MYSKPPDKNQYPAFFRFKRLMVVLVISIGVISTTFTFSKTAHAGLVSFLTYVMGNQEVSAKLVQSRAADSQISSNIVLQASADPFMAKAMPEQPPLQDDTTLSPDIARANATSTENVNTQISIYVVRPGDTISGVADMFDVSVNTIFWANNINGKTVLQPGQTLVILPVTGITHTVKSGDTIQSIAKKYNADVDEILSFNDLAPGSALKVGGEIMIPDGEATVVSVTTPSKTTPSKSTYPGYYSCPVPGSVLSQGLHGHNGVDLADSRGTPIHAAAGGTVIIDRANGAWNGGYGNFIVILHGNGTQTLYAHMSKSTTNAGQAVSRGQIIGYIGMSGLTSGPHVHFEVRGAANPAAYAAFCR